MLTSVRWFSTRSTILPSQKLVWLGGAGWKQHRAPTMITSSSRNLAIFVNFHRRFYSSDESSTTTVLTFSAARVLLGLNEYEIISGKELRLAYYQAAKECHPDTAAGMNKAFDFNEDSAERFRRVTDAYELLQQQKQQEKHRSNQDDDGSMLDEDYEHSEAEYRNACVQWLGQPAEVVEESKRCPVFRQWLMGRTDSAYYWKLFFMMHGGLAPRIFPRQLRMNEPSGAGVKRQRRKRPS